MCSQYEGLSLVISTSECSLFGKYPFFVCLGIDLWGLRTNANPNPAVLVQNYLQMFPFLYLPWNISMIYTRISQELRCVQYISEECWRKEKRYIMTWFLQAFHTKNVFVKYCIGDDHCLLSSSCTLHMAEAGAYIPHSALGHWAPLEAIYTFILLFPIFICTPKELLNL